MNNDNLNSLVVYPQLQKIQLRSMTLLKELKQEIKAIFQKTNKAFINAFVNNFFYIFMRFY